MAKSLSVWNIFNAIAGLASIISLGALLLGVSEGAKVAITVLLILSALTLLIVSIKLRQPAARTTERSKMIEKGEEIIGGTLHTLVVFGGDMSWAADYGPAIKGLTDAGKTVVVIYKHSTAAQVQANAALLAGNGAKLTPVAEDTRLRGFLVDPENRQGARFWLATRRLRKKKAQESQIGLPGRQRDYVYVTREYRVDQDPELIDALLALYLVLCKREPVG
jgi:hypothetical protein